MGDAGVVDVAGGVEIGQPIGVDEQPGPRTEQHRDDVQAQLVDDTRGQELAHDVGAPGDVDVRSPAAWRARSSAASGPSVTK